MAEPMPQLLPQAPRLKFIDMARSVAILLMLEGHFAGATLREEYGLPDHPVYLIWNFFRGVAAPLFFTVAGMVFVYLLTRDPEPDFFKKPRVVKGLKRAVILLFWGYVLQANIWQFPAYLRGEFPPWLSAFHVLQCIGVGLLVLIAIFGFHLAVRRLPLSLCYLGGTLMILCFHGYLQMLPPGARFPAGAPEWFQNMFRGPHSVFPVAPWLAFTLGGGAVGALLRRFRCHLSKPGFPLAFFGLAVALKLAGWGVHVLSEQSPPFQAALAGQFSFCVRAGDIFILLGILMVIENLLKPNDSWFMQIGKHTFPIYVLHVMTLYGGLIGVGLQDVWRNALSPFQAAAGSLVFMAFFVLLVPFMEAVADGWRKLRLRLAGGATARNGG